MNLKVYFEGFKEGIKETKGPLVHLTTQKSKSGVTAYFQRVKQKITTEQCFLVN